MSRSTATYVARFVATRLLVMVALLAIISLGIFTLLQIAPGSVERTLLGAQQASPETLAAIRDKYHLDDPFLVQYWLWLQAALSGDLGTSITSLQPVTTAIGDRVGVSAFLIGYSFVLTMALGVGLGTIAALRARSALDRFVVGLALGGVSAPAFAVGVLLLYVFAVKLTVFPAFGPGHGFSDRLYHLTLPALALAFAGTALVVKVTRTAVLDALGQDYVGFARARGLSRRRVIFVYALRNALVPVVTSAGLVLAFLFTGSVLVEKAFSLSGIGALLVDSVQSKDVPSVQGVALLIAACIILINLLTDLAYLVVDPRIRFEGASA